MTILASTDKYLVEFEANIFTIARRTDGHCKAIHQQSISGDFKKAKKLNGEQAAIEAFLRWATALGSEWSPLYKPHMMPT